MHVPFLDRLFHRKAPRQVQREAAPHCVRCGRKFVASGLDADSKCWWCNRSIDTDPYLDLGGGD
jgi:hypothetical protein